MRKLLSHFFKIDDSHPFELCKQKQFLTFTIFFQKFMNKDGQEGAGGEDGQEGQQEQQLNDSQIQEMHEEAKIAEGEEGGEVIEDGHNPIDAQYQQ